jgi:predicted nucleotidyltransferase
MESTDFLATLRTLHTGGVEFVLVGGVAASLNGATGQTFDVDIVAARDDENLEKLLRVLESVDAIFRIQPARRLKPDMSHLRSTGHKNLLTKLGYLDVLGTIGRGLSYADLLPHSVEMDIGEGVRVRVLDLETIIAIKEELASEKDLAVLPLLRRTLQEKQRRS